MVLFGAFTSVLVAAYLIYLEAGSGEPWFSVTGQTWLGFPKLAFLPIGAICAGCVGAVGYLAIALFSRQRPAAPLLFAMLVVSAGVVFMVQSAELELMLNGFSKPGTGPTKNLAAFSRFLGGVMIHSQLRLWSGEDGNASAVLEFAPYSADEAARLGVGPTGDSRVDGLGSGVQGLATSQDASNSGPVRQLNQMGKGLETLTTGVASHKHEWLLLAMQTLGFALGGIAVFLHLRSLPYCKECSVLMSKKGERRRYFARTNELQSAVDAVLTKARDKQLQQSIHLHVQKGTDKRANWVAFGAKMQILRCKECRRHQMNFRASRKEDGKWKDIPLLAFSATTREPLGFA
jgi:hypothetical protein